MKVSTVIPTYNRGYIIADAVNSAVNQRYCDHEIIVVDDGSADDTRQVVERLDNAQIRYIRHDHNRGCSAAYNTGIAAANGQLVAFLDSDDIWKPGYLELQVSFLLRHPEVDLVFCDTEIHDRFTTIPSLISLMRCFPKMLQANPGALEYLFSARQMYLCLLEEVPVKPTAMLVRRKTLASTKLFNESWPSGTDWDLLLRLSRVACFGYNNVALAVQRRTGDATHQTFREQDKRFLLNVFLEEKAALRDDREALLAVNRGISGLYNSLGWTYLERERWREALSVYWDGFLETLNVNSLRKIASALIRIGARSLSKPLHVR